jgi:type IV pilus assembly protein PilC
MSDKKDSSLTQYQWQGMNRRGEKVSGITEARTQAIAKIELSRQGIIVNRISKKRESLFSKSKKITTADITVFSRQMATMMAAGIPLVQSFDIVAKGQSNNKMAELIQAIKSDVETGTTLADSLRQHPKYFNDLYCNLVDAGEQSGTLETMLGHVATYKEKIESVKKKIKKALFYPIAVLIIAFIVSAALLIFVVPQFEDLFKNFDAELPALTQIVIRMSEIFQAYWYLIFGGVGVAIGIFFYFKNKSENFAYTIDKYVLKLPVIGPIMKKAAIARFARTLSITFAAGMPLVDALDAVAGATGNLLYSEATIKVKNDVSTGQQMQTSMKETGIFPGMVVQMVGIGEEAGALEVMLGKIAGFYEEEVDSAVDALSSLLEPIIMAVLGTMVGGLIIAMYLPIFKLGSVV